jgi:hypothetical protein
LSKLEPTANDLTDLNQDASVETGGMNGSPPKGLYAETELNHGYSTLITRPGDNRGDGNRDVPMTHNNMVPFFGGSVRQNMDIDNRMMADKLETFTGQSKLDQNHKVETTPLFAPIQQNLDQIVEPRELDRYVSSLQIRNNELPFEQVHVGHGLNDGYTARPSGGFHNPLRFLPKTIDELLVNPRVVKEGRVVRGKDPVDQRTAQMQQYKYKPELLVTNLNGERNFTTVGQQVKPMVRSGIVQKPTERQKSKEIIGIATEQAGSKNTAAKLLPKSKVSSKPSFKNSTFRNAVAADGKKAHNNQQLRFENRQNERSTTQIKYGEEGRSFTNCKFDAQRGQVYQNDKAKKTRKQSHVVAANPTGYVNTTTQKGVVYDPHNVTKTTIRETTETNSHVGQVKNDQIKGQVYDPNYHMVTTIRETTENNSHIGQIKNDQGKGKVYNPNDVTRTTTRETTENHSHLGALKTDQTGGVVYNPTQYLPTTTRETTENNAHLGQIRNDQTKGIAYDPFDYAKTTVRETTENHSHIGHVKNDQLKGKAYDPNDTTRTTIRETTEQHNHLGQVNQQSIQKGAVHDPMDQMKTTIKETTERHRYLGGNNMSQNNKPIAYDPTNVAKTTIKETTERGDYVGTAGHGHETKQIAYDPFDVATTTHRETTEQNDYLMPVQASNLQNGTGYQTAPTDNKNTQRQVYSDYYHVGGAGQADAPSNQQLYDAAYNMHQSGSKEGVAEGRAPTLSGMKLGPGKTDVYIGIKKLETDQVNQYSAMRAPTVCNQRKQMDKREITSRKNTLPEVNTYFDPSVLKTFESNPLSQSLQSWA